MCRLTASVYFSKQLKHHGTGTMLSACDGSSPEIEMFSPQFAIGHTKFHLHHPPFRPCRAAIVLLPGEVWICAEKASSNPSSLPGML